MKLIPKFQRKGKLPIMSKEQFEKLQEEKTKIKSDNTRVASKANRTVDTQTKQANKRIADEKARKNIQERDRKRRNQQNNVKSTPSTAQGRGELRENNLVEKAKADYGLKNGLGQMTPIADKYRHTASFGEFMGRSVPESMVSVGTFTAAPQTALFGLGTSLGGSYVEKLENNLEIKKQDRLQVHLLDLSQLVDSTEQQHLQLEKHLLMNLEHHMDMNSYQEFQNLVKHQLKVEQKIILKQ